MPVRFKLTTPLLPMDQLVTAPQMLPGKPGAWARGVWLHEHSLGLGMF